MSSDWLLRLQAACDAGYYATESDVDLQTGFPWQHTVCRDCPFNMGTRCQVDLQACQPDEPVCGCYDAPDFPRGSCIIEERIRAGWRCRWQREYEV